MTGARDSAGSGLWAVTCYFNPMRYRYRQRAFRVFRQALSVPLVAVELSFDGQFDLAPDAADVVLQFHTPDVMWQKERLLNLGFAAVPTACEYVAWLDCDVLFAQPGWAERAVERLREFPIVQLFQRIHYLRREWEPGMPHAEHVEQSRESFAAGLQTGLPAEDCLEHGWHLRRPGTYMNGFAWAAHRQLLQEHGLYDAAIVGGGDRTISCGIFGLYDHLAQFQRLNPQQSAWHRRWAERFREACGGRLGLVPEEIHHVWHGDLANRGFGSRHDGFRRFAFDPAVDIALDGNGLWRWNSDKPEMHRYVRDYFESRREDG